ncbi:hypothetical protein ACHZ97_09670 [Lysobacter soli]|uniref:hypothetical protein n=1 Tax=Lysobacter soli TaxID=453783 RepID=UPI0037C7E6C9
MPRSEFSLPTLRSLLAASRESGVPLVLSIADIIKALSAFVAGEMTREEIADWADFYDANDDVTFADDESVPDVIFEVANPEINGWLDEPRAREILVLLHSRNQEPKQ